MGFEKVDILQDDAGEGNDDLIGGPALFLRLFDRRFENQPIGGEVLRDIDVLFKLLEFLPGDFLPLQKEDQWFPEERTKRSVRLS